MLGSGAVISALNAMIGREDWARDELRAHAGETAALGVGAIRMRFRVTDAGLLEADHNAAEPNVSIDVPPAALAHAFDGSEAMARHARVAGDARFAETIGRLLKYLRPDVGALLSPFTGDIVAHRVDHALTGVVATLRDTARNAGANVYEYVTEETGWIVKRTELEAMQDDLAHARDDLARLEKRIEKLNGRRGS